MRRILKILVVGDEGVGKTCLIRRFTDDVFSTEKKHTIGIDFSIKDIALDETRVKLQIWDFGGHDYYRPIQYTFCEGAKGVIAAFDLSNVKSLNNLSKWIIFLKKAVEVDTPIVLVGTKSDIEGFKVPSENIMVFMRRYNFKNYFETSAKENISIQPPFYYLAKNIISQLSDNNFKAQHHLRSYV